MYNIFKDARVIQNSDYCRFDSLDGYSTNFTVDGDVDGWDVFYNVYLYGSWKGVLTGHIKGNNSYIGRSTPFIPIDGSDFYYIRLMMKYTVYDEKHKPTKGKIRWTRVDDNSWDSSKEIEFDLIIDDKWHLYNINVGPATKWQGLINNLRIYPAVDGHYKDKFAISFIKISSINNYHCSNPQCSYYNSYKHPCPGAGSRGYVIAGESSSSYTVTSGVNDELIVNINNYGDVKFKLGTHKNLSGVEAAKLISNTISKHNSGAYAYAFCEYNTDNKLVIYSGAKGNHSKVVVSGTAAEVFGFGTYKSVIGKAPASGFDYASSRMLTSLEINRLVDGDYDDFAYVHNGDQFSVEAGRRDFNQISPSQLIEDETKSYYFTFTSKKKTIVDLSHPVNNNGVLNVIYVSGVATKNSKIKILRPKANGDLEVVYTLNFPQVYNDYIYTTRPNVYRIDCDLLVEKGDLIGVYDVNLYVGKNVSNLPDATFLIFDGNINSRVSRSSAEFYSFGLGGFAIYARSNRRQNNVILDIDLGERVNVETVDIFGKEESDYFEYNVALCLDVNWDVDLFNESHYHTGFNWWTGSYWSETHQNIAYGIECLDDGIITADNGQLGTVYTDNGLATTGPHSYFYVNGDAEWLYSSTCDGKHEFCGDKIPDQDGYALGFERDPITFTLRFPNETTLDIHKSIIYFKERDNFRHLELSYYMGFNAYGGDTYDPTYKRVPEYTLVKIDGLPQYNTEEYPSAKYLYNNPMDDTVYYASHEGTDSYDPINPDIAGAAMMTDWLILEHNFEPISCKGFRICTRKHHSTKLTEIEVYSRMFMSASLLDNIILSFSDYGDVWNTASFDKIDEGRISAFIGGAPRFFKLELFSNNKFYLNEISAFVGDEVKLDTCEDIVLLDEAKSNAINKASVLELTNIYGKTLDLFVDIPKELYNVNDVLFWSRLNSHQAIEEPEIGPGALLYKYNDYEIRNANRQCAINVPAYALKNLVDGKKAYYSYNGKDFYDWGTISSGISINFDNYEYCHLKEAIIKFNPVSARYWKILKNSDAGFAVHDIECYYNSERVDISGIYCKTDGTLNRQERFIECDGINLSSFFIYDLIKNKYISIIWETRPDYWCVNTSAIYRADAYHGSASITLTSNKFDPVSDFEMTFIFYYNQILDGYPQRIFISLYDSLDNVIFQYKEYSVNYYTKYQEVYDGATKIYNSDISSANGKHTLIRFKRQGNNLKFFMNGVLMYDGIFNVETFSYVKIYFFSYGSELVPSIYASNSLYFVPYVGLDVNLFNHGAGFALPASLPLDEIRFKYIGNTPQNLDIYVSNTNTDDYTYWASVTPLSEDSNFYIYFTLDLEKRHDLNIVRNYGELSDKLWVSITESTEYSNIDSPDIASLVINNSDYHDARWVVLKLLCGDGQLKVIDKLGIYPNIETVFCKGGGYNCEWESLGKILSDYTKEQNVAYQATVTGTNMYSFNFYPTNAVDGISTDYRMDACWGFEKLDGKDPCLELDFGQVYKIHKVVLYHGYNTADDNYMNKDYTISVAPTVTGSFTQIVSITNNSDFYREHEFSPLEVRKLRLTITNYDSVPTWFYNEEDNSYELFEGSFLREIEVYTVQDETHINSEDWPVVCMNLLDQFNITDHQLINNLENNNDNWDNSEEFFKYSDDLFNNPQKVSFTQKGDYKIQYQKTDSSGNRIGESEYIFDEAIYFDAGNYYVEWDSYEANLEDEVSLRLEGEHTIDDFADILGAGWIHQTGSITVPEDGFYDVKAVRHIGGDINSSDANWGARNPIIYRPVGLKKWIAVTRDTATNYSWDNDSNKYGKDYLSLIKVYGDIKYNPTEYSWWWKSTISSLSNNSIIVKEGNRSLQIDYPTSSGADVVEFIEGDSFGQDINFNIKDFLTFWVYIDDVSKLDLDFGDITFGIVNVVNPIYYGWYLEKFNLVNGWNYVRLKFENYDFIYPARSEFDALGDYLYEDLNFRTNNKEFSSIRLRYRGKGESFTWYIDSFKIERNRFDDDVKFGKGLCLSGKEYLEIPISNINLEKGAIEFYLKLNTDSLGIDIFNQIASRPLFSVLNNNNEIVSLSIKSASWFDVTVGDIRNELHSFNVDTAYLTSSYMFGRDEIIHLALVWDNQGIYMDNGDTVRLYINGQLICASKTKWNVTDTKSAILKLGGAMPINSLHHDSYCDSIFHNIKIYNYCKTSFDIELEGINKDEIVSANDFLEISSDGINFYKVGSNNLPIIFKEVPAGESRSIYIRANKAGAKSLPFYNASLLIDWKLPV